MSTAEDLFAALWAADEYVAICHQSPGGTDFAARVVRAGDAAAEVARWAGTHDVWHSVNPVCPGVAGRGTAGDVTRLAALWADFDLYKGTTPEQAAAIIQGLSVMLGSACSFVVNSGGGLHPYWLLDREDDTLTLDTEDKRAAAASILARWKRLVERVALAHGAGTPDNVFDLPRVLRTPGTLNHKAAHGSPRPVTVHQDTGRALTGAEVREALDAYSPEQDGDREAAGLQVIAPPSEWPTAQSTCTYAAAVVAGLATDSPRPGAGRHHWALSQHVRLACALRLGCLTRSGYAAALEVLQSRLDQLRAVDASTRPGEVRANDRDALRLAASKTDEQARAELGDHDHADLHEYATELAPPPAAPEPAQDPQNGPVEPVSSWTPVPLREIVEGLQDGTLASPEPTVGRLDGGGCLFYPGRVNALAGDSSGGKTWTALTVAAQEIAAGNVVLFIDFEDHAAGIVARLLALGADGEDVISRFVYLHPDEPLNPVSREVIARVLAARRPSFVVIDSTGESMALEGADPNSDDDTARWFRTVPRAVANQGPAVLVLDHVTKASEGEGLWASGSHRKRGAINGAQYMQKAVVKFSREKAGHAKLTCAKDRYGHYAQGQHVADLRVTPAGGRVDITLTAAPTPSADIGETWEPTGYMQRVSLALEMVPEPLTFNGISERVTGKRTHVRAAVDALIARGNITTTAGGRGATLHTLARPYREAGNQSGAESGSPTGSTGSGSIDGNREPVKGLVPGTSGNQWGTSHPPEVIAP